MVLYASGELGSWNSVDCFSSLLTLTTPRCSSLASPAGSTPIRCQEWPFLTWELPVIDPCVKWLEVGEEKVKMI